MAGQLTPAYSKWFSSRKGSHTLTVWTSSTLGDWAALTIDDTWLVEVSGDALARLQVVVDTIVATAGGA